MLILFLNIISLIIIILFISHKYKEHFNYTTYEYRPSFIEGMGVFSKKNIKQNELIDIALIENSDDTHTITQFGSKINHCSVNFNTKLKKINNTHYVITIREIKQGDEITISYDHETIPNYIEGSKTSYKVC